MFLNNEEGYHLHPAKKLKTYEHTLNIRKHNHTNNYNHSQNIQIRHTNRKVFKT